MSAFDDKERDDDRPKTRQEGLFEFYDRVSWKAVDIFRSLVNLWVSEMPDSTAKDVLARIRGKNDLGFVTGLAEVFLHAALLRLGFGIEPHPQLAWTEKRLDFLITRDGGRIAYLEITSLNSPDAEVGRDKREAIVFKAISSATIPDDLRLSYEVLSFGKASPSARKIKQGVERWVTEHADAARGGSRIEEEFRIDDWEFRVALLSAFKPRADGRKIAVYGIMDGRFVGAVPSAMGLAKALEEKATKYGQLDLPYVIAVFDNTDSIAWFSRDFAGRVAEVLFGSEETMLANGEVHVRERAGDGWFGHTDDRRHTNVSAILVFPSTSPWYLAESRGQPLLVRNRWATCPLPDGVLPFPELVINEQEGYVKAGRTMAEVLSLPKPWPPEK